MDETNDETRPPCTCEGCQARDRAEGAVVLWKALAAAVEDIKKMHLNIPPAAMEYMDWVVAQVKADVGRFRGEEDSIRLMQLLRLMGRPMAPPEPEPQAETNLDPNLN